MKSSRLNNAAARLLVRCLATAPVVLAVLVLAGCDGRRESREILNMPDMHFSPALKAQEPDPWSPTGSSMRLPPEGTVPINWQPYTNTISADDPDKMANPVDNPLPRTREVLMTGQKYYNIFCISCHGGNGNGFGTVIQRNAGMPMPPSLFSDKMRDDWADDRIYHVLTVGQGNMPSYAAKIDSDKRWAIVHYVRALQRAAHPTEEDLEGGPGAGAPSVASAQ